jgi:hypothetical protein
MLPMAGRLYDGGPDGGVAVGGVQPLGADATLLAGGL